MNRRRYGQQRSGNDGDAVRLKPSLHLLITLRPAHERDVLHRAQGIAVGLGDSLWIFEEREQAVAAHVEKVVEYVLVGRRSDAMRRPRTGWRRGRAQTVHQRHAEDAHIEIERHPQVCRDQGKMMDAPQQRLALSRDLGPRLNHRRVHAVPPLTRSGDASHCLARRVEEGSTRFIKITLPGKPTQRVGKVAAQFRPDWFPRRRGMMSRAMISTWSGW